MAFLLDTNIVSELRRGVRCDARVRRWAEEVDDSQFHISVLTLGEIRAGVEAARGKDPVKAASIERWLHETIRRFLGKTHDVTKSIVERWGRLLPGQKLPAVDALIAATALEHGLTVVTRNVRDFERMGVPILDPWE